MSARPGTLILGWGNEGRLDDGLGPALARAVEAMRLPGVTVETGYQLQIENAAEIGRHGRVLFVDADRRGVGPFRLQRLQPASGLLAFCTHSVAPEGILGLARDLFGAEPEAWLLGIRGYEFDEFGERLSPGARANLECAIEYVRAAVDSGDLREEGDPCETAST